VTELIAFLPHAPAWATVAVLIYLLQNEYKSRRKAEAEKSALFDELKKTVRDEATARVDVYKEIAKDKERDTARVIEAVTLCRSAINENKDALYQVHQDAERIANEIERLAKTADDERGRR